MNWYRKTTTTAQKGPAHVKDEGHGNTLDGEFLKKELKRIAQTVDELRASAAVMGGPANVIPRFRPEIRRSILLLPAIQAITRMSMGELRSLDERVSAIQTQMRRYDAKRMSEILGDAHDSRQ